MRTTHLDDVPSLSEEVDECDEVLQVVVFGVLLSFVAGRGFLPHLGPQEPVDASL
jgi:hypothetical protein